MVLSNEAAFLHICKVCMLMGYSLMRGDVEVLLILKAVTSSKFIFMPRQSFYFIVTRQSTCSLFSNPYSTILLPVYKLVDKIMQTLECCYSLTKALAFFFSSSVKTQSIPSSSAHSSSHSSSSILATISSCVTLLNASLTP